MNSSPGTQAAYDAAVRALFARRPSVMVPGLERIRALCEGLGHPERGASTVHLTGTNGKTTIARMVSALLVAAGRHVGTYTSPHLQDVRERIALDSRPITPDAFIASLQGLHPAIDEVEAARGELVTFFETLTALALVHFRRAGVDARVLEVGMGGRWDATNVVDAEVAVVNRVGLDHAELGSTVRDVAREKAGIIKDGAVVVSAAQEPQVQAVLTETAARRGAELLVAGEDFGVEARRPHHDGQELVLAGLGGVVDGIHLPLHGGHQAANAALALAAVEALGDRVPPQVVRDGFAAVRSPGRLEVVQRPGGAAVILDGAHNPLGACSLAEALRTELPFRRRVLVLGVMGDKDVAGIVTALAPVADVLLATQAPIGRAAPAEHIAKLAKLAGHPEVRVTADVTEALTQAGALADEGDAIVVTGSLYTVGAARAVLGLTIG